MRNETNEDLEEMAGETKMESDEDLERRIGNPDWKQYLPIYGMYQIRRDYSRNRPLITDDSDGIVLNTCLAFYNGISIIAGLGAVAYVANELIK